VPQGPKRRKSLVALLAILAVSLFVVAAVAHLGPSGTADPACPEVAGMSRFSGSGELAGSPGRLSGDGLECDDTSDLAYWSLLAGLAVTGGAVVAATLHRAPDQSGSRTSPDSETTTD
jgi:hypothetical protein